MRVSRPEVVFVRVVCAVCTILLSSAFPVTAQMSEEHQNIPDPIPMPRPAPPPPEKLPEYRSIIDDSLDIPWELEPELLDHLRTKAGVYRSYARQFTCDETARRAEYDGSGSVSSESVDRYGYLLLRDADNQTVRELRRPIGKNGELKQAEVEDAEPFPPAYAWVFLFSEFHEPHFSYRLVRTDFSGFDLVHEIEFRGSHNFTDGKDIRQWEGRLLVDAFTHTPLEIRAEPTGQRERLAGMYRNWAQSFNILGFRTRRPPLGFEGSIKFRFRRDDLTFPTELRYDTLKAVSPTQTVPVKASTRTYRKYRFYKTETEPALGDVVSQP